MTDFANILFGGPCNRRCWYCIGGELADAARHDNRGEFPPRGIDAFIDEVNRRGIREIVFTGTVTDPQLYEYESELLALLRERIHTGARYSVHTNGVRALAKIRVLNQYDRACLSIPSFDPTTYALHTGSRLVPDLAAIVLAAKIPIKISCVLDDNNAPEVPDFLARCHAIGIRRLVFRKIHGTQRDLVDLASMLPSRGSYRGNPLFDYHGMEVGYWDFARAESTSINLFPDGTLGTSYLLPETPDMRATQRDGRRVLV